MSVPSWAQYMDEEDFDEDWGMYLDDEEEKPKHKDLLNWFTLSYSPSRYHADDAVVRFSEVAFGYKRLIRVMDEKQYYVEAGADIKWSWKHKSSAELIQEGNLFTFSIPVDVLYQFYLSKKKDVALLPYAGVHFRALLAKPNEWNACQIGWQAGLRFRFNQFYLGASYSRDFPDKSKSPNIHECSVHLGIGF